MLLCWVQIEQKELSQTQLKQQEVGKRIQIYEAGDGSKPFLLKNKKSMLLGANKSIKWKISEGGVFDKN